MGLLYSSLLDIGKVRSSNQDAIYSSPEHNFFIVADGMGGHKGGNVASIMAIKNVSKYITSNLNKDSRKLLVESITNANNTIKLYAKQKPELEGMGTTINSIIFKDGYAYIGNVGDSRTYLIFKKREIFQLTRDHTLVQEKIYLGINNREKAAKDPHKNILVRAVGFEDNLEVDTYKYRVKKGDIFVQCSDGLYGMLSDDDILYIIKKNLHHVVDMAKEHLDNACNELVEYANKNGGKDNIAIILILAT